MQHFITFYKMWIFVSNKSCSLDSPLLSVAVIVKSIGFLKCRGPLTTELFKRKPWKCRTQISEHVAFKLAKSCHFTSLFHSCSQYVRSLCSTENPNWKAVVGVLRLFLCAYLIIWQYTCTFLPMCVFFFFFSHISFDQQVWSTFITVPV